MAEFKNMTVQALRDLARKALGRGHSRLKTKGELIAALQAAERKVAGAAEKAATKVKEAGGRAARATEKMVESVRGKRSEAARRTRREKAAGGEERRAGEGAGEERPEARATPGETAREAARAVAGAARQGARRVRAALRGEPEPDPEGYMVARVAGEDAARSAPHPLTEGALEPRGGEGRPRPAPERPHLGGAYEEDLGELPWSYADDVLVALPRDPTTLFLYWDHHGDTVRQAFQELDGGRAQLWIFVREPDGGWSRVRNLDFALESRSYYVHDLEPGRVYRAEIHVVDRRGRDRLMPRASNEMQLPPVGPSPVIDDRFMRILWGEPLQRLLREPTAGSAFPEDLRQQLARLSDWSRFGAGGPGSSLGLGAGGMGGRPTSPWVRPSSPTSSPSSSPWSGPGGER